MAAFLPKAFINFWLDLTISSTKAIGFLLGIPVTSSGEIMAVNGFDMRIITQCTALHYVIILSTAILLYSKHSIQYRIAGVVISTFVVIVANALRLIITGVVGSISWDAFVITHDYLWVAAFSLLILGIWIAWADQQLSITREMAKRGCLILVYCTAAYALLLMAMPLYGGFIAKCASALFKLFVSDPTASILFDGIGMVYTYSDGTFSLKSATELKVSALYIGLILSDGSYDRAAFKRFILALIIILCISVVIIAGGGAFMTTARDSVDVMLLWTAQGMVLELALLWWILRKATKSFTQSD